MKFHARELVCEWHGARARRREGAGARNGADTGEVPHAQARAFGSLITYSPSSMHLRPPPATSATRSHRMPTVCHLARIGKRRELDTRNGLEIIVAYYIR